MEFKMQKWRMTLSTTTWKRQSKFCKYTLAVKCKKTKQKNPNIFVFTLHSKIREELGMKPLSREKFSSLSSPSTREQRPSLRKVFPCKSLCCAVLLPKVWVLYIFSSFPDWYYIKNCVHFQSHTLDAILLLLRDLDEDDLRVVHTATQNRLQTYTVDSETFNDSLHTEKSADIQH